MHHPNSIFLVDTPRLRLRQLVLPDAPFIVELLNEPDFLRFIGDKEVRSTEDAERYLTTGPIESYERHGYGLYLVARKPDDLPVGICGLVKRDTLDHPDLGYAFLKDHHGSGYATEAAAAAMEYECPKHSIDRVLAITSPENAGSIRVLKKLGMEFRGDISLDKDRPNVSLFSLRTGPPKK